MPKDIWLTPKGPVTTVSGDLCKGNGSTVSATPTGSGPNTYDLGTTVLTSPTVYLGVTMWYQTTYDDYCTRTIPPSLETFATILPFSSTDISTLCYADGEAPTQSLNYADLNSPVPWSAYRCQQSCYITSSCDPITAPYKPMLDIPKTLSSMSDFNLGCATQPLDRSIYVRLDPSRSGGQAPS